MAEPIVYNVTDDLVDRLIALAPGTKTYEARHQREKVAAATQGSYDALFDPALPGLSLAERLLVALYAARITPSPVLAAHYRARLVDAGATPADIAVAESGKPSDASTPRLSAILEYTRKLIDSRPQREIHPVLPIAPVLLEAKGVAVDYATSQPGLRGWFRRGRFRAVHPVDLALRQGETLGVVGESGSGKSTLAMALLGLQRASEGQIVFHGEPLSSYRGAAQRKLRSQMQIVFQDPFGSLSPRMTIEEIVGEGLALHRPHLTEDERRARVADVLREVGIDARAMSRYPHEFSGGQRQRIAIARALVVDPQILVLDEPTSALDVSIQQQVLHLLAQLQIKYNLSYLFISHDLAVMRAMAHRVLVFRDGRLVEQGDTESVFFDPRNDYTRELVAAAML